MKLIKERLNSILQLVDLFERKVYLVKKFSLLRTFNLDDIVK